MQPDSVERIAPSSTGRGSSPNMPRRTFFASILLAALSWAVCVPYVPAQTTPLRVVLLLDRSRSMERVYLPSARPGGPAEVIGFDELIERLSDFVLTELPDNTELTLVTFGEGAEVEGSWVLVSAARRRQARDVFHSIRPDQDFTNLARALETGLRHIAQARPRSDPGGARAPWLVLLISDGKNNPPRHETLRLDQVRQLSTQLHLTPGKDFVFWYAHIGEPEKELQEIARTWGQVLELKANWELEVGDISPRTLQIEGLPGNGTAHLTVRLKRRNRGKLSFHAEGENLPENATITVESVQIQPEGDHEVARLRLAYAGFGPGEYFVRVRAIDENPLNLLQAVYVLVKLTIVAPRIVVAPEIVRIPPLSLENPEESARITLTPDDFARGVGATVRATLNDALGSGVRLDISRGQVVLHKTEHVEVRASLNGDAMPGAFSAELQLTATDPHVLLQPERVRIVGTIEPTAVHLEATVDDPTVGLGKNELAVVLSAPVEVLRRVGGVGIVFGTPRVEGEPSLRVEAPDRAELGPDLPVARLKLVVDVPREGVATGARWRIRLPVRATSPLVTVVPGEMLVSVVRRPEPKKVRPLPAQVRVVLLPHNLQRGTVRVPLRFETSTVADPFDVRVQVERLSDDAPELLVREKTVQVRPNEPVELVLNTQGSWPPGSWKYRLTLAAVQDLIVLEPAGVDLVVESPLRWLAKPPPLRPGAIRWPFQLEVLLPRGELPQDLSLVDFQYSVGGAPFVDGAIQVAEQDRTVRLLCRGGEAVSAPASWESGRATARLRLTSGSQVLLEWDVPIELRPPLIKRLILRLRGEVDEDRSSEGSFVKATARGPYGIEVKAEIPGVVAGDAESEVLVLESSATEPDQVRREVLAVLSNPSASDRVHRQQIAVPDLALGAEVYRDDPPKPGWVRGRPRITKTLGIAVVVREPSGTVSCSDVLAVRVTVPAASGSLMKASWWAVRIAVGVLAIVWVIRRFTPTINGLASVDGTATPRPRTLQAALVWESDLIEPASPSASTKMSLFQEEPTLPLLPWRRGSARLRRAHTGEEATLRLYAVGRLLFLRCDTAMELDGVRYPAGKWKWVRTPPDAGAGGYRKLEIGWPGGEGEATLPFCLTWVPPGAESARPGTEVLATS